MAATQLVAGQTYTFAQIFGPFAPAPGTSAELLQIVNPPGSGFTFIGATVGAGTTDVYEFLLYGSVGSTDVVLNPPSTLVQISPTATEVALTGFGFYYYPDGSVGSFPLDDVVQIAPGLFTPGADIVEQLRSTGVETIR
jgi:hypothetical protein